MLLAVVGNVNGQELMLRRALESVAEEGILTVFQTGNLLGPQGGDGAPALLREYGVKVAQGSEDRLLVRFQQKRQTFEAKMSAEEFSRIAAMHEGMSSATLEYLRAVHKVIPVTIDGVRVLACHGSPNNQDEILSGDTAHMRLQRIREAASADLLLCGGAAEPFHRWVDGALFVGPGQLESPTGRAQYVVVDTDTAPWSVGVREV